MRTVVVALVLMLSSVALSGCSGAGGDSDGEGSTSASSSSTSSSTTSSASRSTTSSTQTTTASGNSTANRAPSGSLTANVNGTNATFALAGTDADGDTLSWALDFGDGNRTNGTTLPTTVVHAYARGNYTAHLNVSDGQAMSASSVNVTIHASASPGDGFAGHAASDEAALPCNLCSDLGTPDLCAGFRAGVSGQDCVLFPLPTGTDGRPFTLTAAGGFAPDPDAVTLANDCDAAIPPPTVVQAEFIHTGPEAGTVPVGARCFVVWQLVQPGTTFTLTIT